MKLRTVVCASGELGFSTLVQVSSKVTIIAILVDSSSQKIISWAKENSFPVFIGNPRKKDFSSIIKKIGDIDLLISINYLFIIEKNLINLPKLMAINIHGSMLPKYRGRAPHIWAIINGEKSLGITIHQIDEGCDTGDIILQKEIELSKTITGGEVLKMFTSEYPLMLSSVIDSLEKNQIVTKVQNNSEATYFEKRGPEDGEISWDWEAERIYNWVRALTAPYPGAFTYLNGKKVLIWKIEEAQLSFNSCEDNGKILKKDRDQLFVKVPNKVLKITHFSQLEDQNIDEGDVFTMRKVYE